MKEQVLVFPADRLEPYLNHFSRGAVANPFVIEDLLDDVLAPGACRYMDREAAEKDPSFKQVIPYCLLSQVQKGKTVYYAYERTKKTGESRLHCKMSVGVGGHINPCDGGADGYCGAGSFSPFYEAALRRELVEEVSLPLGPDLSKEAPVVGLIYDDSDEVGRVHFGVVHKVLLPDLAKVHSDDPALANGTWYDRSMLMGLAPRMENWSQLVVERMLV